MKKKLFSILLLVLFLFSSSCQKKQVAQTPVVPVTPSTPIPEKVVEQLDETVNNEDKPKEDPTKTYFDVRIEIDYENENQEEATIKYSGIILSIDWSGLKIGRATQEQFDALKKAGIAIYQRWEWVPVKREQSGQKQKIEFVKDPYLYLDLWNKYKAGERPDKLSFRFYRDINADGIPELFLPVYGGTGGSTCKIYQITPDEYKYLNELWFSVMQTIQTKHNGFNDLMTYTHFSADDGCFYLQEFNGYSYEVVKEMRVMSSDTNNKEIFFPDEDISWEKHSSEDKLLWSQKDDDKYRRRIK